MNNIDAAIDNHGGWPLINTKIQTTLLKKMGMTLSPLRTCKEFIDSGVMEFVNGQVC